MFAGPRQQLRQGHEPRRARNLPAAVHKHQRRYALDGEAPQQFWHRVAVHLDQPHLRLELGCRPFENWRHCPAGTAPGRPEINEQRNVTVPCMLVEAHDAVQYNRPTFVKWQTAGPALPAIRTQGAHWSLLPHVAPPRSPPVITWMLIATNCLVFLFQDSLGPYDLELLLRQFALIPARYSEGFVSGEPDLAAVDILPFFS